MTGASAVPAFDARRNVRLLLAYSFVANFQLWIGIWIIYLTDWRGVSLFFVGLLETFFQLVSLVARVPAGAFADRFGRRRSLITAMVVEGSGLLLFGLAGNYLLLLVSYVLWAVGGTLREPANAAYLYDALAADGRADDFAKVFGRLTALVAGGFLAGTLIGSPIAQATTLQTPVVLSALSYASALLLALLLREPPRAREQQSLDYWGTIRTSGAVLRRDPAMRYLVLLTLGTAFAAAAQIILLQPFLQAHDVPVGIFGLIQAPLQLAAIGASLSAYALGNALGTRRAFALLTFAPVAMLLLLAGINHVLLVVALGAVNVVTRLRQPLFIDYLNRRIDSDLRATVLAMRRMGFAFVLAFAAPLVGALAQRSLPLAFLLLALISVAVVAPAYVLWLRADRAGTQP